MDLDEENMRKQIKQLEDRVEELRLETIPDVEQIRRIQSNIDFMRGHLEKIDDEIPYYPA